jgi:hypothetical protein
MNMELLSKPLIGFRAAAGKSIQPKECTSHLEKLFASTDGSAVGFIRLIGFIRLSGCLSLCRTERQAFTKRLGVKGDFKTVSN